MSIVLFDVCDTLYATNTTVGFLRFLGKRGDAALLRRVDRWTSRRRASFYLGALAARVMGWDLARTRMIAGLKGYRRAELDEAAREFAAHRLPSLANSLVVDRLEQHRANGDEVWLVSSSLQPVVDAIARQLNIAGGIGSRLQFDGNRCTGRLEEDLTGRKDEAVRARLGGDFKQMTVYTDNRSDRGLIGQAGHSVIVIPAGRTEGAWAGEEHEYIRL